MQIRRKIQPPAVFGMDLACNLGEGNKIFLISQLLLHLRAAVVFATHLFLFHRVGHLNIS